MKRRFLEDTWRKEPTFRALCLAFASCRTPDEAADFLRDVATLAEMKAFAERLECAKLLAQGLSYREVASRTGASTTTVARVARFLESGEGGYRRFLKVHRHHRVPHAVVRRGSPELPVKMHHHEHAESPSGERPVSALQKVLERVTGSSEVRK